MKHEIPDITEKVEAFVARRKQKYSAYICDTMLVYLLVTEFYRTYATCKSVEQSAYQAGINVFQLGLQYACQAQVDGEKLARDIQKALCETKQ
jgi:hypothetical protein